MNSPASLDLLPVLQRIAEALERLAPAASSAVALDGADAFVWHPERDRLEPVHQVNRVDLSLLQGISRQTETLYRNTRSEEHKSELQTIMRLSYAVFCSTKKNPIQNN